MLERILFIPDTHRPYHDERAWKLMLRAARRFKPHRLVVLGDFGDFYSLSHFDRDPNRHRALEEELASVNAGLDELDALGARFKHFVAGNHEARLERYLKQKAPELFNLVQVAELLRLRERGWRFTPYRQHVRIGKVYVTHDIGQFGAHAHLRAREAFEANCIIGHTHRMAVHYGSNVKGRAHVGAMFGWLGDASAIDYEHSINVTRQWQLGFGLGWKEPSGVVHLQACPIVDYRVVIDGKLVKG